jgi:hypothetical protein
MTVPGAGYLTGDAGGGERVGRHGTVQVPGDGDRSLARVLDVGRRAETAERGRAEIVGRAVADEQYDVAALLAVSLR